MPHLLTASGGNSMAHGAPHSRPPNGSQTIGSEAPAVRGGPHHEDVASHSGSSSNRSQSDGWGYPRHPAAGQTPADTRYHGWHGGVDERIARSSIPSGSGMSSSPGPGPGPGVDSGPGGKHSNPNDKDPGRPDATSVDESLRNVENSTGARERPDLAGPSRGFSEGHKRGSCDDREMAARSMLQLPHSPPSSKDTPASISSVDADAMALKDHTIKGHHGGELGGQDTNVAVVTPNVTSGSHQPSPHDQTRPHAHDYDRSRYGQHPYHDQHQSYHYDTSAHHRNRPTGHETGGPVDGSASNSYHPPHSNYRPQAPPGPYPPHHHAPPGYYSHPSHPPPPHSHHPPHMGYGPPPQNEQHGAPPASYYPRHHSSPNSGHHHGYGPPPHSRHNPPPAMHHSGRQMMGGYYSSGQHAPVHNGQHDQPNRDPHLSPPSPYPDQRSNNTRGPPPRWNGRQDSEMGPSMKQTSPSASFDSESTSSSSKELPCEAMTPNSSTASRMISPSMAAPAHHGDFTHAQFSPSRSHGHGRDSGGHHKSTNPYQSSRYPPPPPYYSGQHQSQPHHPSSRYPHHPHHPPQPPPNHSRHPAMPPQPYGHQSYPHGGSPAVHGGVPPPVHGGGPPPPRGQQKQYPMGMSPSHGPHSNGYGYNPSYPTHHQHPPPHHGAHPPPYPHPPHHHEGPPPPHQQGGPPPPPPQQQGGHPPPPGKVSDRSGTGGGGSSSAPPISPSSSVSSGSKRGGSPAGAGGEGRYPPHQQPHQHQDGHGAPSINSVAQWQQAQRVTGVAPSANRCVPLKGPIPSKFWGDMEKTKDAYIPAFDQLVNFPDYLPKNLPNSRSIHHHSSVTYGQAADGTTLKHVMYRHCVMCGKSCLCTASSSSSAEQAAAVAAAKRQMNQEKNTSVGGAASSCSNGSASSSSSSSPGPIIPRQNKGLCTKCDVTVWCITQSGLEIKWCKGCKNFRPWAAFGDKGLATKCVKCRERQKEKYAAQKEAAAAAAAAAGGGGEQQPKQAQQASKNDQQASAVGDADEGVNEHSSSKCDGSGGDSIEDEHRVTKKRKAQENRSDDEDPGLGTSSGEGDDGTRQAGEGANNGNGGDDSSNKKGKREPPSSPEKQENNDETSAQQQQRKSTRRMDSSPADDGSTEIKEQREEREEKERKRLEAAAGLSHLIAATSQM